MRFLLQCNRDIQSKKTGRCALPFCNLFTVGSGRSQRRREVDRIGCVDAFYLFEITRKSDIIKYER